MGCTCIAKEHLVVNSLLEKEDRSLVDAVIMNISTLFGFSFSPYRVELLSVRYEDERGSLFFLAEKKNYNELGDILYRIDSADRFDISIDYINHSGFGYQGWAYPSNESLYEKIRKLLQEDARWKNRLFFSIYCSEYRAGVASPVIALGCKDGKEYNGEIAYVPCDLPEDGCWTCDNVGFIFDDDITEDMDPVAIVKIAEAFAERFPEATTITPLQVGAHLEVNEPVVKSREDFETLIELYAALCRATNNRCSMLNDYYDLSGKDGRALMFDIKEDGTYSAEISCV